jgi:uncharacterized protein
MRIVPAQLFAAIALLLLCAGLLAAWILAAKLVRSVHHAVPLPADFPAEVVSLPGPGHAIAGWWVDRGGDSPVVLLLHPVRGERRDMVGRARGLLDRGFSVLLIDLQGRGETPGDAITFGLRESADVQVALAWIKRVAPSRRVGVIGNSLGGAAEVSKCWYSGAHGSSLRG